MAKGILSEMGTIVREGLEIVWLFSKALCFCADLLFKHNRMHKFAMVLCFRLEQFIGKCKCRKTGSTCYAIPHHWQYLWMKCVILQK